MNSNSISRNFGLLSRNEGKIKSYESCRDLRAWSHDIGRRDHYLREWIKYDMPICVIPTSTVICILKKMTCHSKGKTTPRCHPRCKSKYVLDSICTSCHAMKECFRNEQEFGKYFEDEEFETNHWPCEKCLEALKSIKMFWKIIVEKLFRVNMSKNERISQSETYCTDSVRSVAKLWQTDMVQQALFIKRFAPLLNNNICPWNKQSKVKKDVAPCNLKPYCFEDYSRTSNCSTCTRTSKFTDTLDLSNYTASSQRYKTASSHSRNRLSRHTLTKPNTVSIGMQCTSFNNDNNICKKKLNYLEDKFKKQKKEIAELKTHNGSLKIELQNMYKNSWWKYCFNTPFMTDKGKHDVVERLPQPFEASVCEENKPTKPAQPIDSEMIITMKNCTNEYYRHISLLQVLHKSNSPVLNDMHFNGTSSKKEDPLIILAKVQSKFSAIVSREMSLANERHYYKNAYDIEATYHNVNASKSEPSCSTTTLASYDSFFDTRLTQET